MLDLIIQKTREYLAVPSVVGHEQFFMDYLYHDFQELGVSAFKNQGLLEVHGSAPRSQCICAHIDRHGLISLGSGEYVYAAQYIKEIKYGEGNDSSRKQIESLSERFDGEKIFAYHPDSGEHLGEGIIRGCFINPYSNDASFNVEGVGLLEQNIPLAYARKARFEDGVLKGQIDNVISIAVVYALFKAGYQGTALLTCEEEIGKSWVHMEAFLHGMRIDTQRLIVLDTSPYYEQETIENGPVIFRNRDKSEFFNKELVALFKVRCEALGLPYKVKDEIMLAEGKEVTQLGSTEQGKLVMHTSGRWNGATVQIPTLMYHTSNETTTATAIEHYFAFLNDVLIENVI